MRKEFGNFLRKMANTITAEESPPTVVVESTENNMTMAQLLDLLNISGTATDALGQATYYACLRVLSEGMGKLPLKLQQRTADKGVVDRRDLPLYHALRTRPNPLQTSARFWSGMETSRHHYGNSYAWIRMMADGSVQLWQMPSQEVTIYIDDGRRFSDEGGVWYIWQRTGGTQKLRSDEVIHLRTWLSLDGITGLAVCDILRVTLSGAMMSQEMLNKLYESGFISRAVLHYTGDLNDELVKGYVDKVGSYAKMSLNDGGGMIPLPAGTDLTPLNIKLTDSQFNELRQATALQVAAAFGIKPDQINDYSKSSYASSEAQQLDFLVGTQLYAIADIEQELSYKLLTRHQREVDQIYPKFNTAVVLRADTKTQIETLVKAIGNGLYTPNEARDFLDLSHKAGGDELLGNGSLIPLAMAGKQYGGKEEKT